VLGPSLGFDGSKKNIENILMCTGKAFVEPVLGRANVHRVHERGRGPLDRCHLDILGD